MLRDETQRAVLAFQQTSNVETSTWPQPGVPQQLHLDLTVASPAQLQSAGERARALGAQLIVDRSDDPDEPLLVHRDLDGHPFCIFVTG